MWSVITGFKDDTIIKSIDKKIDNDDGDDTGDVRWHKFDTNKHYNIIQVKYAAIKNPND